MRILITGSNGLLGQKIVKQLLVQPLSFLATSQGTNRNPNLPADLFKAMDITDQEEVNKVCADYNPTVIINTAAMTNVDTCEEDQDNCHAINVNGVQYLANYAQKNNCHLIQLSTDFVFDGKKGNYAEDDERNPLSVYATSKVNAEDILLKSTYQNWSIVRTIIVYGEGDNLSRSNIVVWAKKALRLNEELKIVDDQFRAPTWADDLAWACIRIAKLNAKGIYHIAGPETMSMYDLVKRIGQFYGFSLENLKRISSKSLSQSAARPPVTGFNLSKSVEVLGYSPKTIEETLPLLY